MKSSSWVVKSSSTKRVGVPCIRSFSRTYVTYLAFPPRPFLLYIFLQTVSRLIYYGHPTCEKKSFRGGRLAVVNRHTYPPSSRPRLFFFSAFSLYLSVLHIYVCTCIIYIGRVERHERGGRRGRVRLPHAAVRLPEGQRPQPEVRCGWCAVCGVCYVVWRDIYSSMTAVR